ncbi:MAG: dephospho-CoA kinase [Pirellulaceae bacterium]|nr:MAG: dephospho-CoA kinase [Pirellulaceae bacterium]
MKRFPHLDIVGVIGGIGSGKSEVARRLAGHGGHLIEADKIGHQVLEEPEVRQRLYQRWGEAVLDQAGRIDRRKVAARVFGETPQAAEELRFLESVVHPRIGARMCELLEQIETVARQTGRQLVVVDAAVLLETGWAEWCDALVFVDAPQELRQQRATARGWSATEWRQREARQWPLDKKRRYATAVIQNDASLEELRRRVDSWWESWKGSRTSLPAAGQQGGDPQS